MTILANGQVAAVETVIFLVDRTDVLSISKAVVDKITFFNEGPGVQTALLSLKKFGGVSRIVRQFKLKQNEGGEYLEPGETLQMDAGDSLLASTSSAANVNFVVLGAFE